MGCAARYAALNYVAYAAGVLRTREVRRVRSPNSQVLGSERCSAVCRIYVRLDVLLATSASPLRVWVNKNSTVCYKARDIGVKEAIDKYLPGRRDADCNLYRRRCHTEPRSRRCHLPPRAHRCYKLLPIVPLICRSSERPTRQRQCGVTTSRK